MKYSILHPSKVENEKISLSGLIKSVPAMVTGCLRSNKVTIFVKAVLVKYEKYGTLSSPAGKSSHPEEEDRNIHTSMAVGKSV